MTPTTDLELLPAVTAVVHAAGAALTARFAPGARPVDLDELGQALAANNLPVMDLLGPALVDLCPGSGYVEETFDGDVPAGPWWVIDPVSGNWNTVHGLDDWSVVVTLLRDREPVLTVVYAPASGLTHTAVAGAGARVNGGPIVPSAKRDLAVAGVATSQSEDVARYPERARRIGRSVTAMLGCAFAVGCGVPAITFMTRVADGRLDAFWFYGRNLADSLAGVLLAREAGAVVTDTAGTAWTVGSDSLLIAPPALHPAMLAVLRTVS